MKVEGRRSKVRRWEVGGGRGEAAGSRQEAEGRRQKPKGIRQGRRQSRGTK